MNRRQSFRKSSLIFPVIFILLNLITGCKDVNSPFYDQVLNDFDANNYFVALDIRSSSYRGPVIITNNNLYLYLRQKKGLDKERYKSFMKTFLMHHRTLRIGNGDLNKWNFIKASEQEDVLRIANRGVNSFIAYFFDGRALKFGITEKEQNAIIYQLFFWKVPAKIDKISGELLIG
jgi:hypothetical protein